MKGEATQFGKGQDPRKAQAGSVKKRKENRALFSAFLAKYDGEAVSRSMTKKMDERLMSYGAEKMREIVADPQTPLFIQRRAAFLLDKNAKFVLEAQKDMLDRVAGKATQPFEDETQSARPINVIDFSKPRRKK